MRDRSDRLLDYLRKLAAVISAAASLVSAIAALIAATNSMPTEDQHQSPQPSGSERDPRGVGSYMKDSESSRLQLPRGNGNVTPDDDLLSLYSRDGIWRVRLFRCSNDHV